MSLAIKFSAMVTSAALLVFSTNACAADGKVDLDKQSLVGKTYLFDYGDYAYDITITSEKSLHWSLVKGSFKGPKNGDNPYLLSEIADGVVFISWKEESGMQFYNVINWKTGKLTTHADADGMFLNTGTVLLKK